MCSKVYIKSAEDSAALRYTLDFIFASFFGLEFELCLPNTETPEGSPAIFYGGSPRDTGFCIPSCGYLAQGNLLIHPGVEISEFENLPVIFTKESQIPFDVFSAIFYLLARVEEYVVKDRDKHGRFQFKDSIMADPALKGRPIIDEWLLMFSAKLQEAFPNFTPKPRSFQWLNTFDIDIAFAFTSRSPLRILAATAKNIIKGDFTSVKKRVDVLRNKSQDPFDTYDLQEKIARNSNCLTQYFFLLGSGGVLDRNISPSQPNLISLIKRVRQYAKVGIHPSYLSGDKHSELKKEIGQLSGILGETITRSRQHYLRMSLPETYTRLIAEGIKEDFTMGYAEAIGFRSGTCTPHFFFNLLENRPTELKVHPLAIMEGTLRDYLKENPEQAVQSLKRLIDAVADVQGQFVSLWHNDSLRDDIDNPWKQVYIEMADYINSKSPKP